MAALRKIACLAALAAATVAPGPASAQNGLRPVAIDTIVAGIGSCARATGASGVDVKTLEADGWKAAPISEAGKEVTDAPVTFYSRNGLLLFLMKNATAPACIFTGRLKSLDEFRNLRAAVSASFGSPLGTTSQGDQLFNGPNNHILAIAPTGTSAEPAVRVMIGPVRQETK